MFAALIWFAAAFDFDTPSSEFPSFTDVDFHDNTDTILTVFFIVAGVIFFLICFCAIASYMACCQCFFNIPGLRWVPGCMACCKENCNKPPYEDSVLTQPLDVNINASMPPPPNMSVNMNVPMPNMQVTVPNPNMSVSMNVPNPNMNVSMNVPNPNMNVNMNVPMPNMNMTVETKGDMSAFNGNMNMRVSGNMDMPGFSMDLN